MSKKKPFKRLRGLLIGILFITILGAILVISPQQSILSISSVTLEDGKVFWTLTGTANNVDEGVVLNYNPSTYTKPDGVEVEPQESLQLFISKGKSECSYQLLEQEEVINFGLTRFNYYLLQNPERVVEMRVQDDRGNEVRIDGTIVETYTITDRDGEGEVFITPQGIIAGKTDCPDYENVAIYVARDGEVGYFLKNQWDDYFGRGFDSKIGTVPSTLDRFIRNTDLDLNSQFLNSFNFEPELRPGVSVIGQLDIGNVLFTIKADQDYFNSIEIAPAKPVDPEITNVFAPKEIKEGDSSSMKVTIQNKEDSSGRVTVSASSSVFGVTPSFQNVQLIGEQERVLNYIVSAPLQPQDACIKVEVCWTGEFGGSNCDSENACIEIVEDSKKVDEECGDGFCQISESSTTCPQDCFISGEDPNEELRILCDQKARDQPLLGWTYTETTKKPSILKEIITLGFAKEKIEAECKARFVPYYIFAIAFFLIGVVAIFVFDPKRKKRRKK